MAGIYVHIPFCKQACHYCDFHFTTSLVYKEDLLLALQQEIALRKDYLAEKPIESIYFGGGTPSLLSRDEISRILDSLARNHHINERVEITLEANPDDLTPQKIRELKGTWINRFSIGVQSFFQEDLTWMNRAHTSAEAERAIKGAQDAGFENITADLIYGYPLLTDLKWASNINQMCSMDISHISAYSMTVEPQTALGHYIRKGEQKPMNEGQSADQFIQLVETLEEKGYEQYEISNYAKNECYAVHNSNYWKGIPYLGLGPSAHSYRPGERQWNISNNAKYISAIKKREPAFQLESLSPASQANEYIMTSLRTKWGLDAGWLTENFKQLDFDDFNNKLKRFIDQGKLYYQAQRYVLTLEGKLLADHIAADLFLEDEE